VWKPPSPVDLFRDDGAGAAVGAWYTKDEAKETQFATFLRIHGYGRHLYEHLDPILLATLVVWDDAYPDEAGRVIRGMWESMRAEIKNNIRLDLIRNDILDRCEAVLGAHPATAKEFLAWVQRELVSQPVQERVGDTVYTFQLKAQAPFLYGLLAARKVAGVSPKRCDAILEHVIATYSADDDLLASAAQLYAADKGLAALEPPVPLKQPAQLTAWQLGVVETSLPDLLAALEHEGEAGPGEVAADEARAPAEVVTVDESAIVADGSAVRCSVCGKSIRRLEAPFAGRVVTVGMDPSALDQWYANVCVKCRKVFCDECLELGGPTPCPTCGEPTLPAQRLNLERIGLSPAR
jgi:hypothetical protein